ncbi:MAG: L,D-transpeptidase [Deltaproteobacteria bacterium]|nr:L,D-transpeptidase [Deltaproteobacteria bacterium]
MTQQLYGLHGPVTPSLIWGAVTAGCVRMRPLDLGRVFAFASKHPGTSIRYTREVISLRRRARGSRAAASYCPEATLGVRRLRAVSLGKPLHDRICGGVDHWFSVVLQGGEIVSVSLQHRGALRLELYGIRAISPVARGTWALRHYVLQKPMNRGARYLRVVAPAHGTWSYTLSVRRLR